jgi:type I restriction-modification system DNA methylase subunit
MANTVFSSKDFKPELLNTFFQGIANREEKIQLIRNWQKAIENGTVHKKKEEQLKGEFLDKFFGQLLGYAYESHEAEWNIEKEFKSISDGKKPDAALGFFDPQGKQDVRCVIEVKGGLINLDKKQNRADFQGSPVDQAFNYVHRMPGKCDWVIVTNMIEIRLYSRISSNLFESFLIPELLITDNLQRFFFLLSHNQLFLEQGSSRIENLFNERQAEQKKISSEFYNAYHDLRLALFADLQKSHPKILPKKLFGHTQKLIDRIIFICFVRDRELVSSSLFADVHESVKKSFRKKKESVWTELKHLFAAMNEGLEESGRDIPEFNGGLFKEDEEMNSLHIRDHQLTEIINFVASYDFQSQLDVNILGHIFEQSITDIEDIQSSFDSSSFPPRVKAGIGARKKDGVYYTPDYITRYIVKEAVGGWLDDRRKEIYDALKITDLPDLASEDYETAGRTPNEKIKLHITFWESYREQLKKIKVLDPACGSGAFLTQVFDYLWKEWEVLMAEWNKLTRPWKEQLRDFIVSEPFAVYNGIDEWKAKKNIVANNIFGVDLNPESVEITKLSLWLKTANRKESLADLSGNIKQGNSLIDDPKVAGDDAFDWNKSFAEIMQAGGFDVVVGNPPYAYRKAINDIDKIYFKEMYKSYEGNYDLYKFFMEKIVFLSKDNTLCSFIVPNTFLSALTYKKLREILINEFQIKELYDLGLNVFDDVVVESIVFIFKKGERKAKTRIKIQRDRDAMITEPEKEYLIDLSDSEEFNIYLSKENKKIVDRIEYDTQILGDICYCTVGINTGYIKEQLVADKKIDKRYHKVLNGKDIGRYTINWPGDWIMYDSTFVKSQGELGRSLPPERIFKENKILIQRTRRGMKRKLVCYFDNEKYYNLNRLSNVILENKKYDLLYIYILLNSELMDFYFNKVFNEYEVKPVHLSKLPIKKITLKKQQPFIALANKMLELNKFSSEQSHKFIELLQSNFPFESPTNKLKKWYDLEFIDLLAELEKAGAKIPAKKQSEWLALFKTEKAKIKTTQAEIDKTDKEIDDLVYELYGLTPEEIAIVEKS